MSNGDKLNFSGVMIIICSLILLFFSVQNISIVTSIPPAFQGTFWYLESHIVAFFLIILGLLTLFTSIGFFSGYRKFEFPTKGNVAGALFFLESIGFFVLTAIYLIGGEISKSIGIPFLFTAVIGIFSSFGAISYFSNTENSIGVISGVFIFMCTIMIAFLLAPGIQLKSVSFLGQEGPLFATFAAFSFLSICYILMGMCFISQHRLSSDQV